MQTVGPYELRTQQQRVQLRIRLRTVRHGLVHVVEAVLHGGGGGAAGGHGEHELARREGEGGVAAGALQLAEHPPSQRQVRGVSRRLQHREQHGAQPRLLGRAGLRAHPVLQHGRRRGQCSLAAHGRGAGLRARHGRDELPAEPRRGRQRLRGVVMQ